MKIAAYAIAKNEEKHVARWYESVKDADYIFILDTGSTDNTVEIALSLGIEVQSRQFDPFRFDHARNFAIACLPHDIDLCVVTDLDEILTPGWREALEELDPSVNRVNIKAVVDFNADGSEGQTFSTGRIHGRHTHEFRYAIHEVLTAIKPEVAIYTDKFAVHHYPDNSKSRGQYLEMLKISSEEQPNDERLRFYLAREYFFHGRYELAQHHFTRHLAIAQWNPERSSSHRYMAKMRPDAAEHHLYKAVAEDPTRRESWVALAALYYDRADWIRCASACEMALAITEKPTDYFCETDSWNWYPYDLAAISNYHLGDVEKAWDYGVEAMSRNPQDERLQANLTWYRL
jgi:glycosyltransferase involved in cell wall biosynthesis